jgi:hypothetical protein
VECGKVLAEEIINKLFSSFSELEQAILQAKVTLSKKDSVPEFIVERLNSYDSILEKQRELASNLCFYIEQKNTPEIGRHVGLINQLSQMIRDDAKDILGALTANEQNLEEGAEDGKEGKQPYIC